MSIPDRPGDDRAAYRADRKSHRADRETYRAQPWDWRIDPPPPSGPDREPVADPAATAGVDAPGPTPPNGTPAPTGGAGRRMSHPGDPRFWLRLGTVAVPLLCCGVVAVRIRAAKRGSGR